LISIQQFKQLGLLKLEAVDTLQSGLTIKDAEDQQETGQHLIQLLDEDSVV